MICSDSGLETIQCFWIHTEAFIYQFYTYLYAVFYFSQVWSDTLAM